MSSIRIYDKINEWFEIGIKNIPGIVFTTGFIVSIAISRRGGKIITFLLEQCPLSEAGSINIYEYNYSRTVKRRVGIVCSKNGLCRTESDFKHQDLERIISEVGTVLDKHFNHME